MKKIIKICSFAIVGSLAWVIGLAGGNKQADEKDFSLSDLEDLTLAQKAYADVRCTGNCGGGDDDAGDAGPNECDPNPSDPDPCDCPSD